MNCLAGSREVAQVVDYGNESGRQQPVEQTGRKLNAFCWIQQPAEIEEGLGVKTMTVAECCLAPGALLGPAHSTVAFPKPKTLFKVSFASKKRFTGSSSVEKPLDMHRIGCAKATLLQTNRFFSNIRASWIQSLSSQFASM
ncbi:MAG: hypothetical protein AB1807_22015 [Pseudomonadota bacterium]